MLRSPTAFDRAGATLSILCAIHCMATPLILVALPAAAKHSEAAEAWIVATSSFIGFCAIRASWRRNGALLPRIGIALGLTSIIGSRFLLHGPAETILVFSGAAILVTAHLFNCRECRGCGASHSSARGRSSLLPAIVLLSACSLALPASAAAFPPPAAPHTVVAAVRTFLGWPYRLGGNSARGLDCSALVQRAFRIIGVQLPRTAAWQFRRGCAVAREELAAGDLVFFHGRKGRKSVAHVGIYMGGGRFIHAGRHGVVMASLYARHWVTRFAGARRVIEMDDSTACLVDADPCAVESEGT